MAKKLSLAILSFTSLCFIIQGLTINPEDLDEYYKCYAYAKCFSDGPAADKLEHCFNVLKPEEMKSLFQLIKNNYYPYKSDKISDAVREFCHYDNATQLDASNKTINGIFGYQMKVCGDSNKADTCSRSVKGIQCIFSVLEQFKKQGECCIKGPVKKMVFND